jgi:hypothetical protein
VSDGVDALVVRKSAPVPDQCDQIHQGLDGPLKGVWWGKENMMNGCSFLKNRNVV